MDERKSLDHLSAMVRRKHQEATTKAMANEELIKLVAHLEAKIRKLEARREPC